MNLAAGDGNVDRSGALRDLFASVAAGILAGIFTAPHSPRPSLLPSPHSSASRSPPSSTPLLAFVGPSHLLGKVLAKIRRDGAKVLLVAPLWPHARWWNLPIWQSAMRKWQYVIPMNDSTVSAGQGMDPKRWPRAAAIAAVVDGKQSQTPPHSWTATRMSGTQF